jgi:hypothetical protein
VREKQFEELVPYGTKVEAKFKAKMDAVVNVTGLAGTRELLEKMAMEFFINHPEASQAADQLLEIQKNATGENLDRMMKGDR